MKNFLKVFVIPIIIILTMVEMAQSATVLFPYQGGTGQNSATWTGFPYITAGIWGTTTLSGLYDVLGQATSTLTSHTTTYNHTNYNTAYSWGNHAGLYDILGQATSTLGTHTTTYNHALFLTSETDPLRPFVWSGSNVYLTTSTSNVGIGTTSPSSLLNLWSVTAPILTITSGTDTDTIDPTILFRTGAIPATRMSIYVDHSDSDRLKMASTTTGLYPTAIFGTNDYIKFQIAPNASTSMEIKQMDTSYLTFDTSTYDSKMVVGKNLETGTLEIDPDSGAVNFANMNISTLAATSTAESLSVSIDGTAIITAYGESSGYLGNLQNPRVGINTTTTPTGDLEVKSSTTTTVYIGSATMSGCIGLGDTDGAGLTYITALDGILTASSIKPANCK